MSFTRLSRAASAGLLALTLATAVACGGAPSSATPQAGGRGTAGPAGGRSAGYTIGVDLELSGPAAVWGTGEQHAIDLLAKHLNAAGGINGVPIRLIYADNQSDPTQALVAAKKLVNEDHALAVIGGGTTPTTMPVVPFMEQAKIPLVSVGSATPIIEPVEQRKWIFKTPIRDAYDAQKIVSFLRQEGVKTVAFVSVNNAYGDSGLHVFTAALQGSGVQLVAQEKFEATDKDMKPILTRVRAKNPDAIVVWAIPPGASLVAQAYHDLGLKQTLVFSEGAGSNAFVKLAKGSVDGTYMVAVPVWVASQLPDSDPRKGHVISFVKAYREAYGEDPGPIEGMAYDALLLLSKALVAAGPSPAPAAIRDALENLHKVVGVTGVFNLSPRDHNGLGENDLVIIQMRDGKWVLASR